MNSKDYAWNDCSRRVCDAQAWQQQQGWSTQSQSQFAYTGSQCYSSSENFFDSSYPQPMTSQCMYEAYTPSYTGAHGTPFVNDDVTMSSFQAPASMMHSYNAMMSPGNSQSGCVAPATRMALQPIASHVNASDVTHHQDYVSASLQLPTTQASSIATPPIAMTSAPQQEASLEGDSEAATSSSALLSGREALERMDRERRAPRQRKKRTHFSQQALQRLREVFHQCGPYPSNKQLDDLSKELGQPASVVRVWCKNQRAAYKRAQNDQ